jgi:uroporphyrinogen decarboxylase
MAPNLSGLNHQPDFGRVVTALHHQEPDRVPLVEATVDFKIMSQFLGKPVGAEDLASQVEFWTKAGYDFIPLTVGMMQPGEITRDSQISKVIEKTLMENSPYKHSEDWNILRKSRISNEDDLEAFPWEEAAKIDLAKFHEVQAFLPAGMKIIAMSGKIFTLAWMLMGFENFAINLKLNPKFIIKVIKKVAQIQLDGLKQVSRIPNVAAAWAVDDLAYKTGPMIRPKDFRDFIFPWYEEFSNICRENDLFFFFHSDGVISELIEDMIAIGVNALHPIDPTCMDIEKIKTQVKNRLAIFGNISNELLENGTPQEVAELTRMRIRKLAPGGGYCLGSGNSVPDWAKIENYRAMIETCLQDGKYPITTQI